MEKREYVIVSPNGARFKIEGGVLRIEDSGIVWISGINNMDIPLAVVPRDHFVFQIEDGLKNREI